ncbi:MAG: GTPase Era [Deltaproteobacteria bacterium TMED126]|nr:GTPase Era [Candidatus Dadabacteria bacterium]NSW97083.1 GTPase Era [Deltaproteobacteria bacterium TMED126]|tara:strand:+ start:20818 stop:21699 length:882 start_codon:yes stop_codon:yes gene_type:complete
MENFKAGTVSIIGKPNTGKSTLINTITGRKISAVSDKPNTTRNKILGVLNSKDSQMLFLDTPGLQKSNKFLNRIMVQSSMQAISEADVILVMIDGTKKFSEDDLNLFDKIKDKNPIVAINKIDLIKKSRILGLIENLSSKYDFVENFIPISALNNEGTNLLLDKLKENLPFDEKILPDDTLTDQPEKFYLSEIIREKIFTNLYQEVPYRIAVVVEEVIEKKKIVVIQAYIVAESSHHKQIIIGKKGQMIKKVGEESRVDIQEFLNCKVFLDLRVKVDSQWLKIKDKAFNYSNI